MRNISTLREHDAIYHQFCAYLSYQLQFVAESNLNCLEEKTSFCSLHERVWPMRHLFRFQTSCCVFPFALMKKRNPLFQPKVYQSHSPSFSGFILERTFAAIRKTESRIKFNYKRRMG